MNRTFPTSVSLERVLRRAVGTGLLMIVTSIAQSAHADAQLHLDTPVEIDLELDAHGKVVADDVEILEAPRSAKLRGPVSSYDPDRAVLRVLDWSFRIDDSTRFDADHTASHLVEGRMIELKWRAWEDGLPRARSIEIENVKRSWKIKGTITRKIGPAGAPEAVEVNGLRVAFTPGTDIVTLTDRVAEDLFRDLREEDQIGPEAAQRRWMPGGVELSGSVRHHFRHERELDLRDGSQRDLSEPSIRLELRTEPARGWKVYSQLRWIGRYALRDEGAFTPRFDEEQELHVRQLYVSARDVGGRPFGAVIGKQRIKDDREFLFDEYLDAARIYAYGLRPLVLEATWILPVVPLGDKFEDWEDVLLQARVYPGEDWQARAYALLRQDRSDRNRDVEYYGVSVAGDPGPVKTWLEAALLRGEDKGLKQRAWALDAGLALRAKHWPGRPGIWAGWAMGTGDDDPDDGISREFRQTGYEDNSERIWGLASLRSYGELLDPELSNLRTWTVGMSLRPRADLSVDFALHTYRLDRLDDEFDRSDLLVQEESLDGFHDELGHELDVVVGWRDVVENLHLVGRVARFDPGPAFGPRGNAAWKQMLELRWDF